MILAYQHIQICCKCNMCGFFCEISEEFLAVRRRCGQAECLQSKRSFFGDIEGLHNGVENLVEIVKNLDFRTVRSGGAVIMEKIT